WNKRVLEVPTPEDALVVARALRIEGDREARRLAEQIEQACRAAISNPNRRSPAARFTPRPGKLCGRGNAPEPGCHIPYSGDIDTRRSPSRQQWKRGSVLMCGLFMR